MQEHQSEITKSHRDTGSFRDPSGFVFVKNGVLYRQVNQTYAKQYDMLMGSGLYTELVRKGYIVSHEEVAMDGTAPDAYKILTPERIPFISYPYEWCFSELKDAALLTLKIQKIAMRFGMTLKDASAYNIQFRNGHPILIDTLSFEKYTEGAPWVAYRQFCEHFLAPLALMSYNDIRLGQLLKTYLDGIPLDLASKLLPRRSWFRPAIFFHIHMHAKSVRKHRDAKANISHTSVSRVALESIIESLKSGVSAIGRGLSATQEPSERGLDDSGTRAIQNFISSTRPKLIWDIGGGMYHDAFFGDTKDANIVAFDHDYVATEAMYLSAQGEKESLLPLVMDFANPSPPIGWANEERASLIERGPADLVLALGVIQQFAIAHNAPFQMIAEFFAKISKLLIIEFVPKDDAQASILLKNRADIFGWYAKENFEKEFERYFSIKGSYSVPDSERVVYLMVRE